MMCTAAQRAIGQQEDITRLPHQQQPSIIEGGGLRQSSNHLSHAGAGAGAVAGAGAGAGARGNGGGGGRVMLSRAKRVAPPISGQPWPPAVGQAEAMVIMAAQQQLGRVPGTRINLQELKAKLNKILGPVREVKYWNILSNYLELKVTKQELEKLVPATIGRENISLHNQLLRGILINALSLEAPSPPTCLQSSYNASSLNSHDTSKPVKGVRRKPPVSSPAASDEPSPSPTQPSPSGTISTPVWANGDGIVSPRKGRSTIRDRKAKDRPSPLGLPKAQETQTPAGEDGPGSRRLDHTAGAVVGTAPDVSRSFQRLENAEDHSHAGFTGLRFPPSKRPKYDLHASNGFVRPGGRVHGASAADHEDAAEDEEDVIWANKSVDAPFGIPFCNPSIGAPEKAPVLGVAGPLTHSLLGYSLQDECLEASDLLPDTHSLLRQMRQTAVKELGLQGVSLEAANVVNHGLDVYLKRMMTAAIKLSQCRRSRDPNGVPPSTVGGTVLTKDVKTYSSVLPQKRTLNGTPTSRSFSLADVPGGLQSEASMAKSKEIHPPITAADFMGSVEHNPQAFLGEDWPMLLERVSLRLFLDQ